MGLWEDAGGMIAMGYAIGIRREDKNEWERRVPLAPQHVATLVRDHGIPVYVQPSGIRVFPDDEYRAAGAVVQEDLSPCRIVLGVKEMPPELFRKGVLYVFFSHTIKGQAHNIPMLRALLDAQAHLLDYERIVDAKGRRLVLFGHFAGLAGMIESLHALGQRLASQGFSSKDNPFITVKQPYAYGTVEAALQALRSEAGRHISEKGLPDELTPFVVGVLGYGNVARGALEVLEKCFPVRFLKPEALLSHEISSNASRFVHVVVFEEKDTVRRRDHEPFDLEDYWNHPEKYEAFFARWLPFITVLINAIYWDSRYPVLVTAQDLQELYRSVEPKLKVIGDITCDLEGSIAVTRRATSPSNPCYVYDTVSDTLVEHMHQGHGPVIMAVDNLPCEFPREASESFGNALMPYLPDLCRLDLEAPDARKRLPEPLQPALIVQCGSLAPDYAYLHKHLETSCI